MGKPSEGPTDKFNAMSKEFGQPVAWMCHLSGLHTRDLIFTCIENTSMLKESESDRVQIFIMWCTFSDGNIRPSAVSEENAAIDSSMSLLHCEHVG